MYCALSWLSYLWDFDEQRGGESFKSSLGVAMQAISRDNFYGKEGFLLCKTAVLKLYCKSYWVL